MGKDTNSRVQEIQIPDDIFLPFNINKYNTESGVLLVAPEISSIVLTNEVGSYIVDVLRIDSNVDNAFYKAIEKFEGKYTKEQVYKTFLRLIGQMNIEQFSSNTKIYKPSFTQIEKGLHIYLTKTCNLKCIHCYNEADSCKYEEMSFEQLKEAVDFFAPNVINFSISGGEPLVSPNFFNIVKYIKDTYPDKTLSLYSNGTLIDSMEKADFISENFNEVQISIDGASEEVVNSIRGKNSFKKIIRGLKFLCNTEKPIEELAISICLFEHNIKDLCDNLLNLLDSIDKEKRIKSIRFSDIEEEGRGTKSMQYIKSEENITNLVKLQDQISFSGRRIWERFQENVFRNYFYFNKGNERRVSTTCSFGQTLALDSNGDLYPCAIKKEDIKMGNFFNKEFRESLLDTWNNCFNKHTVDEMDKCKDCDIKYYCIGGCRVKNRKSTGAYNIPDCDENKKREIIEKLAHDTMMNYSCKNRDILRLESTL